MYIVIFFIVIFYIFIFFIVIGLTSQSTRPSLDLRSPSAGLTGSFAPCAQEAEAEFEVTESDLGIDWTKSYEAGEAEEFPIPGLTVGIPILGTAQVELAVELDGDASALTVSLGLDACIVSYFGTKCGSDLTSELPYYALNEQYDFSDYCQGGKKYGTKCLFIQVI